MSRGVEKDKVLVEYVTQGIPLVVNSFFSAGNLALTLFKVPVRDHAVIRISQKANLMYFFVYCLSTYMYILYLSRSYIYKYKKQLQKIEKEVEMEYQKAYKQG